MRVDQAVFENLDLDVAVRKTKSLAADMLVSFRVHTILYVTVVAYIIAAWFVERHVGGAVDLDPMAMLVGLFTFILPLMLLGVVIMRFAHVVMHVRPTGSLTVCLLKDIGGYLSKPARFLNAIPATIALIYFMECFSLIKDAIPFVIPFSWDVAFMELDRSMHFGVDPWRLLQPVLGHWWVTLFINLIYNLWFLVIWFVMVALAFADRQSELRMQYFVAFFLTWSIGGSLLAIVFSSAGPVYYGKLGLGPDPYAPLVEYLRASNEIVHLWAVNTQSLLWDAYMNDNKGLISGISAMPSMHNATAVLLAFLGWRVSRLAGIAATVFAVMIFIGSVHLGWHYAVDGYAALLLVGLIWWVSGHLVRWYFALPVIKRDIESLQDRYGG